MQTDTRTVMLCDRAGAPLGTCNILHAHKGKGRLHRAFSVFVFRDAGKEEELLIQRRSQSKMLFPLRWANTCCSHLSLEDQDICSAGIKRLYEECGFCLSLKEVGAFVYRAEDPRAVGTEYEHDTVLVGRLKEAVKIQVDPAEIVDWKWVLVSDLKNRLREHSHEYAPWLSQSLCLALDSPCEH